MNNFNNIIKIISLSCLCLTLSGCELLGPKKSKKIPLTPVLKEQPGGLEESVVFQELKNKEKDTALQSKIEMYPAGDKFTPRTETFRRSKTGGPGTYSLNFDDADLGEVAKVILSDILGQNYVLSPKVTGKVTLNTTEPLTKEELIPTLEMVLRMNNAALVKDGKIYHIEPSGDALYSSTVAGGSGTGFQSRVIPIRNVAAQEIADILKPLVHDKTVLNVDSTRNSITVQGTADELARIMDIVSTFDIDLLRGRSFALFPLNHADPDKVIDELESIFDLSEKEDGSFFRFLNIERMNAILAITHQASYLRDVENWIYRLDRANTESGGGVTVYRVQHMDAEELADTLNEIFTGAGPRDKSAKVAAGRKSAEASNKSSDDGQQADASNPSATGGASGTSSRKKKTSKSPSRSKSSSGGGNKDNDISIVSDIANNSLIITATPQEMNKIMPVIKQLDIMPLQVLIDATIAEVTLKDDLQYGIQWYFSEGRNFAAARGIGSPLSTQLVDAAKPLFNAAAAAATGGLSTIYDAGDIKMLLRAQADLNNTKVISSPSLMVLNNQEATINVGDEVPAPLGSTQVPIAGGGNNPSIAQSNTIQYLKTGVTLEVTPRVNSNGLVILDISQEVKNAVKTQSSDIDAPTIQNKEISSIVAVKDGETLALGGLIRDQNDTLRTGIPFLHELPLIGPLFGSNTRNENRTELVVLITPRVVKTKQDARVVTNEFKHKLSGIYYDPRYPQKKGDWWRKRDW